jgi:HAD superfamily phosphoserine phosphatase-like hydrolase
MFLVFDFDGTITEKDTIGVLADAAIQHHKAAHGLDLQAKWDQAVKDYMTDYEAFTSKYQPSDDRRLTLDEELKYLSALKEVEAASLARVGRSGIFAGMDSQTLHALGAEAVSAGKISLRRGFPEIMEVAKQRGHRTGIVSVNWSRSFIRGVLSPYDIDIIANEVTSDGQIAGPGFLGSPLTTEPEKLQGLKHLVAKEEEGGGQKIVYFGDSTTDLSCLLVQGGVVMARDGSTSLMKTLARIGVSVPHVSKSKQGQQRKEKLHWAADFGEVLESGLFDE